jgi:hypothetical protein
VGARQRFSSCLPTATATRTRDVLISYDVCDASDVWERPSGPVVS